MRKKNMAEIKKNVKSILGQADFNKRHKYPLQSFIDIPNQLTTNPE